MRHRGWESYCCPSAYLLPSKLLFSYILQSPFLTFARTLFFSIFFPLSLCPCFHRRVFIHAASLNPPETDPSASLSLTISYLYPNIHKSFCVLQSPFTSQFVTCPDLPRSDPPRESCGGLHCNWVPHRPCVCVIFLSGTFRLA